MKNLYAFTKSGNLVHINQVDKMRKESYTCCQCNNSLIARKGKIKAHHFSHKQEGNCNYETYLHKVSKLVFFKTYTECLRNRIPFFLEYKTQRICNSCEKIEGINHTCNLSYNFSKFDLTTRFDQVFIEQGYNGYIADILLKSSTTGEIIFIEFAVTHKCTEEKINNGHRIIEFSLTSDEDFNSFTSRLIKLNRINTEFHNFKTNENIMSFRQAQSCKRIFETFTVLRNGKAEKKVTTMSSISKELALEDTLHFEILKKDVENEYTCLVQNVSDQGVKVLNCLACKFCAKNRSYNSFLQDYDLFCKKHKAQIEDPNHACKNFWRRDINQHYLG